MYNRRAPAAPCRAALRRSDLLYVELYCYLRLMYDIRGVLNTVYTHTRANVCTDRARTRDALEMRVAPRLTCREKPMAIRDCLFLFLAGARIETYYT